MFIVLTGTQLMAQENITGVYNLSGVMETASGFKLNKDSTFEFYFSYGALDRYGSGTWKIRNGQVSFRSKPWPGKDFKLVKSSNIPGNDNAAVIAAKNSMLLPYVYFTFYSNGKSIEKKADTKGYVGFPVQKIDSIMLQFEFTPERKTVFRKLKPGHNNFEFVFEPWLVEVFFINFKLSYEEGSLKGGHPLLSQKVYSYTKE